MNNGFTLLETLMYIALLTLILGSGVISVFHIVDASEKNKLDLVTETEAQFLMKKIEWQAVKNPTIDLSTLFDTMGGRARLLSAGTPIELTSSRVTLQNLLFTKASSTLRVQFTANDKSFSRAFSIHP